MHDLDKVLGHLDSHADDSLARLKEWLSIPSVSTDPAYGKDIRGAAAWAAAALEKAGLDAVVHPTRGHPIVLARTPAGDHPAGGPHLLFYGHYDVQPPDPVEKWVTPPFEPTVRGGAIYARGASDDKGQVACLLEALRAWKEAAGKIPLRMTVLIEGEEECGSANLGPFIREHKKELSRANAALICDTTMWDARTVAITYGLRGLLYFDLKLHNPKRDLHSGMYGGTLANPAVELTAVLGGLFDKKHRVAIPGFYDDVMPVSKSEKKQWERLGFEEFKSCLTPIGVKTPYGEAGFSTLERKWVRPSCDINGLYGGYGGAGAKTVIPSFAGAKVSFRLAPNQDPKKIGKAFERWLRGHDVHGCRWEIKALSGCRPVVVASDSPHMAAAARAIERTSGRPPVLVREGATIPVVGDFKTTLGLDTLLIGFGLPDDAIHSPNEKFNLANFRLGCRTLAGVVGELAKVER